MSEPTSWTAPPDTELATPTPPETVFNDPLAGDKISLPSGGWAVFRDPTKLRSKHQEMVLLIGQQAEDKAGGGSGAGKIARGFAVTRALLGFLVLSWSVPYDRDPDDPTQTWMLPSVDSTVVSDLKPEDHTVLMDALEPARKILFPDAPTPDDHADPASPTEPASA
jgi:hypothetical protein